MAYVTEQELIDSHLPGDVAQRSTSTDRVTWIEAASAQADGYLRRAGYTLPLASAGEDLKAAVGSIATYRLAAKLGLIPEPAHQSAVYLNYKAAVEWLQGVANGSITPIVDNGGDDEELPSGGPKVTHKPLKGW